MPHKDNTPVENSPMKLAAHVTLPVMLALLVISILFFKERMLYIDAPHMLFRIINDGHMHIEEHRYGSFISQFFPWLGVRLHLPLKGLMIFYSTGFYLFYLAVGLLLVYKYMDYGLAVLLGLYFTVFVTDTYYWPNNEVHQGITWLVLAFAVCRSTAMRKQNLWIQLLLFTGFFFLAIWTHPLVMLAAVYLWFFYVANGQVSSFSKHQVVLFSCILVLLSVLKFCQGLHHNYDGSKIEILTGFDIHRLKNIFTSPQFHFFINGCIFHYQIFTALFIAGLVGLLINKKYILFAWTVVFVAGYLFLMCATYWDFTLRSFMESEYMPMVIICCTPFVYHVLPKMKPGVSVSIIFLVYLLRIGFIFMAAAPFTNRVALLARMNEKMRQKNLTKIVITKPLPPTVDNALIYTWGAPVESIFISALKGEKPQRTFIFLSPDELKDFNTASKDTLLGSWEKRAAININSRYAAMDTSVLYKVMSYPELME